MADFVRAVHAKTLLQAKLRIHVVNLIFTHMLGLGVEEMRGDELFRLVGEIHDLSTDMWMLGRIRSTKGWDNTALIPLVSGPKNIGLTS